MKHGISLHISALLSISTVILLPHHSFAQDILKLSDLSIPEQYTSPLDMTIGLRRTAKSTTPHDPSSYAFRPPQVPLDVDGYATAPQGLELEQVHVYIRHGERAPVGVRLASPPASIPERWIQCKAVRQFQAAVAGSSGDATLQISKGVERSDGTAVDGECLLGELTDIGRQTTFKYGEGLRKLYVERLGFLSDVLQNKSEVYFRSTNMPRTIESLQQVIHGLYPTSKCDRDVTPPVLIRNGKDENLLGNTLACKRLEMLQVGFAQAAASIYNPTLEPLDKKISKYLDGKPIRVDGKPRASGIMDTVRAAIAHGIQVPPEFEDKAIVDVIERAVVNEWFAAYKTEEGRRLGMGRLLDDLSNKMQHKASYGEQDKLKILVHSTHDTAIAALCSTLDVFDDQWPAFAAAITFELFKKPEPTSESSISQAVLSPFKSKSKSEHFVRMRYQNKDMILPMCADEGKHLEGAPEFCTLAAFRERVKDLTPVDWDGECAPGGRAA